MFHSLKSLLKVSHDRQPAQQHEPHQHDNPEREQTVNIRAHTPARSLTRAQSVSYAYISSKTSGKEQHAQGVSRRSSKERQVRSSKKENYSDTFSGSELEDSQLALAPKSHLIEVINYLRSA